MIQRQLNFVIILWTTIHLSSCALSSKHQQATEPVHTQPTIAQTPAPVQQAKPHQEETLKGVDPAVSLRWLKNGNIRFVKNRLRKDGQSMADVKRLAAGQTPHTVIVSCSDSRVPPEILFDQKLGEIFVVRTAGETLDPTSIASVEYAVEHLGARSILVMGHSKCGAIKAACGTLDGSSAGSDNLNKLVADIHPRLAAFKNKTFSKDFADESWANAIGVSEDLVKRSNILTEKVHAHQIQISTALYNIETGLVSFK